MAFDLKVHKSVISPQISNIVVTGCKIGPNILHTVFCTIKLSIC